MSAMNLIWVVAYLAVLTSIWTVNSASEQARWLATSFMIFIAFIVYIGAAASSLAPKNPRLETFPTKSYFTFISASIFILKLLLATAFTYANLDSNFIGSFASYTASFGAALFPFIGKFETVQGISELQILRAGSIMTIFVVAGILIGSVLSASFLSLPAEERRRRSILTPARHPFFVAGSLFFTSFLVLDVYFGWSGYIQVLGYTRNQKCILKAYCYLRGGDLTIFLASAYRGFIFAILPMFAAMAFSKMNELPVQTTDK
ncbi:hypothetical protein QBK99_01335 [Corticibacterium sp. UT-5YL-CI-8]|nr:hypothetical protein [Tianweitania sp. UT-5YL-CI-8]